MMRGWVVLVLKGRPLRNHMETNKTTKDRTWGAYEVADPVLRIASKKTVPSPHPIITDPTPGAWVMSGPCLFEEIFIGLAAGSSRPCLPWERNRKGRNVALTVILPAVH